MALKWEDVGKGLKRIGSTAFKRSEELTRVGRVRIDIAGIRRNVDKAYRDLGEKVYNMITVEINFDIANNEEVKELIGRVRSLQEELKVREEELERLREERREE